jgi:hypothetical protein
VAVETVGTDAPFPGRFIGAEGVRGNFNKHTLEIQRSVVLVRR